MRTEEGRISVDHGSSKNRLLTRTALVTRLLPLVLLLTLPAAVQAQFTFTTNSGALTIKGYTGTNNVVIIPSTTNGMLVTRIGDVAFASRSNLRSVTIPDGVTNIGVQAFQDCTSLTNIAMGNGVTSIGSYAFMFCTSLRSATIPNGVTRIWDGTFSFCSSLTNITIPNSVTSILYAAFESCTSLRGVCFEGNAPALGSAVFRDSNSVTNYYLPGTTGWNPQVQTSGDDFGVRTNRFGFSITATKGLGIVVDASTNLANPIWFPLATNSFVGIPYYFSDPQWTNHPARFYRTGSQTFGGRPLALWNP